MWQAIKAGISAVGSMWGSPDVVQGPMEGPMLQTFSNGPVEGPMMPGYAGGGSFIVPGGGGTDSSRVGFDATPGERVTIETPNQQKSGDTNINVQLIDSGATTPPRVEVDKQLEAMVVKIMFENINSNGPMRKLMRR